MNNQLFIPRAQFSNIVQQKFTLKYRLQIINSNSERRTKAEKCTVKLKTREIGKN